MNEQETIYSEWESDFYQYLCSPEGGITKKSRTNYISWMRFLNRTYHITTKLSVEDIDRILESERRLMPSREQYNKKHDWGNFRSCLRKFLQFTHSDYVDAQTTLLEKTEQQIKTDTHITATEKDALVKARVGQGRFRRQLIDMWHGCSITQFGMYEVLMASHIKPWRDSTNEERLSVFNGLLLLPNYDKLFDKGYISFNKNGKIVFSSIFEEPERKALGLTPDIHLIRVEAEHKKFLEYHRTNCLIH